MRIVFNDSFAADPNLFKTQTNERSVFVSNNLILEKKIILAAPLPPAQIDNFVLKYKKLSDPDKEKMLKDILNKNAPYDTWEDVDRKEFRKRIEGTEKKDTSEKPSSGKSKFEQFIDTAKEDAEKITEPFEDNSSKLDDRSVIIDRLKGFGVSDDNIGKFIAYAFQDNPIPESEILSFLDLIFDFAIQAGTNIEDIVFFALEHFSTRRSKGVTYDILKAGSTLQEKYPELNIFSMLRQSVKGQNFGFGKLAIIEDSQDMELAKLIFSLTQHKIVEQNEAARRERQMIRDKVQAVQERTNLQRALVSALDANEVERALIKEILKFGEFYKSLISNPVFRALKKTQYIINAGRKLLDTWMTVYLDTQPITPRLSPEESRSNQQSISDTTSQGQSQNKSNFPSRRPNFFTSSSSKTTFYKIAQTGKVDLTKEVKFFLKNFETSESSFTSLIPQNLPASKILLDTYKVYKDTLKKELTLQLNNPKNISFSAAHAKAEQESKKILGVSQANENTNKKVIAQTNPQGANYTVTDSSSQFVQNVLLWGTIALGLGLSADALLELVKKGKLGIIQLFGMLYIAWRQYHTQNDLNLQKAGRGLPSDKSFYDADGNLTRAGADILANRADLDAIFAVIGPASQFVKKQKALVDKNKIAIDNFEKILNNQIFQQVDYGMGQTSGTRSPLLFPEEVKKRYEEFVAKLEEHLQLLRLLQAGYTKLKTIAEFEKLDANQKRTLDNAQLSVIVEIKNIANKINDFKTTNKIRKEIEEQKRARYILESLLEQYSPLVDAGINISSIISQPDGFAQVFQFARENLSTQLDKLVETYEEITSMIDPVDLKIQNTTIPQNPNAGTVLLDKPGDVTSDMVQ